MSSNRVNFELKRKIQVKHRIGSIIAK